MKPTAPWSKRTSTHRPCEPTGTPAPRARRAASERNSAISWNASASGRQGSRKIRSQDGSSSTRVRAIAALGTAATAEWRPKAWITSTTPTRDSGVSPTSKALINQPPEGSSTRRRNPIAPARRLERRRRADISKQALHQRPSGSSGIFGTSSHRKNWEESRTLLRANGLSKCRVRRFRTRLSSIEFVSVVFRQRQFMPQVAPTPVGHRLQRLPALAHKHSRRVLLPRRHGNSEDFASLPSSGRPQAIR